MSEAVRDGCHASPVHCLVIMVCDVARAARKVYLS